MSPKKKMTTTHVPPGEKATNFLFDSIDVSLLENIIEKLRSTDMKTVDFEQVQEVVNLLMDGFTTKLMGLQPPSIFRARKNGKSSEPFTLVKELWYPPKEVAGMGRLNKAKESVFYCSDDMNVALLEIRPEPGDKVTLLQCEVRNDYFLRLLPIGIQQYLKKKKIEFDAVTFEDELPGHMFPTKEDFKKNQLIHDFFLEELTKVVAADRSFEYNTTVAMSLNYLNDLNNIDGILYPSVASQLNGKNMAVKPKIADEHFVPLAAWELSVEREKEPMTFECLCINESKGIEHGMIHWK